MWLHFAALRKFHDMKLLFGRFRVSIYDFPSIPRRIDANVIGVTSSLHDKISITTPITISIAKLPTVAIGKHDLSFESHSIQDYDVLGYVELLWDVRGEGAKTWQRKQG